MTRFPVTGKVHETHGGSAPFRWFIYGSSLDTDAFAAWAAEHGHRVPDFAGAVPARLDGWRLAFNVMSRFWGGAVASLEPDPSGVVEGVVLDLPGEARPMVDHKEGAVSGLYEPFDVQVTPLAGGAPLSAVAYRAAPSRKLAAEQPPSPAFLETLRRGARRWGLTGPG